MLLEESHYNWGIILPNVAQPKPRTTMISLTKKSKVVCSASRMTRHTTMATARGSTQ